MVRTAVVAVGCPVGWAALAMATEEVDQAGAMEEPKAADSRHHT